MNKKLLATIGILALIALAWVGLAGSALSQGEVNPQAPWSSSAPVPEGVSVASPPDPGGGVDPLDSEIDQTYNAFLRIAGSALKPRESNVEWSGSGGGGCMYANNGNEYAVFNTPIMLEQGATIKYLRMYFNDTNASLSSTAWFTVYDLYGAIVVEHAVSSSGSSGNGYATTSEFTQTVDYDNYSYVINWRPNDLGSDMQVCGFRIYYHTPSGPTYMPLITKE